MSIRDFTKSGAFVAIVFALVVVLLPFGLEDIGEATDLFKFPVKKTISGWLSSGSGVAVRDRKSEPVDWESYRMALGEFAKWAESCDVAVISLPTFEVTEIKVKDDSAKPERRLWTVPVASCTAAAGAKKGYVFLSGVDHPFVEGSVISPSKGLCGYEIVCIGERCVWFRAVFDDEGDDPMGIVRFPEFTRVERNSLLKGNRKYVARDAFPLSSGGWLLVDSFMPPDGVVFKILDEGRSVVATILCIVIGEKGGG